LRIVRRGGKPALKGASTMLDWLHKNDQPDRAINRFWRVVLVSALNEQLERIDAGYGIAVFWKAFLATPAGFGVGIPSVPLGKLYSTAADLLQRREGTVSTRCGASQFSIVDGEIAAVRLDDGRELRADYYVSAVTIDRLLKLLPADTVNFD